MKIFYTFIIFLAIISSSSYAQNVGINNDGSAAHPSAMLDVKSQNKGVLLPRVSTSARMSIVNPAAGLLVYDSTERTLFMFDGKNWLGFAPLTNNQRPASNFQYGPDHLDTTLTGYSVSMWDQFAAVGVPYRRVGANYIGGVYIYRNIGGEWQYSTTLSPTGNNDLSFFGISVNVRGNFLIVGASNHLNASNERVGAAYIYNFNGTTWNPVQTLFGTTAGTGFGAVVSINQFGNYCAISEPDATVSGLTRAGVVRIYNKPAASFSLQATLQDPAPAQNAGFGTTMAMSPLANYALIGAPNKTVSGHYGNGYIGQFRRSGTVWNQQNTYTPISQTDLRIGDKVDISESYAFFSVGKTKEIHYSSPLTSIWGGYTPPPMTDNINSLYLDPTTDIGYVFSGKSVYHFTGSSYNKIKTLSSDQEAYSNPQLITVYNKNYCVGLPHNVNSEKPYVGAIFFGVSPQ